MKNLLFFLSVILSINVLVYPMQNHRLEKTSPQNSAQLAENFYDSLNPHLREIADFYGLDLAEIRKNRNLVKWLRENCAIAEGYLLSQRFHQENPVKCNLLDGAVHKMKLWLGEIED